jgi:hypothetical protein
MEKYILEINIIRNERKWETIKPKTIYINYITNSNMPKLDIYDKDKI